MNSFTLIYGCMFSGKTTKLIELYQQSGLDYEQLIMVKPLIDDRYKKQAINSHSGISMPALRLSRPEQIESHIDEKTAAIFIDEVQFFGSRISNVISSILCREIDVYASGLLLDSKHEYFGPMRSLQLMADTTIELYAKCNVCQQKATHTFRTIVAQEQILVGHQDIYQARCKTHWEQGMQELLKS